MENDLISRSELLRRLECAKKESKSIFESVILDATMAIIDGCQTIDAIPVRHGRWERRGCNVYCTYCQKGYRISNGGPNVYKFRYCPNCSATMEGA